MISTELTDSLVLLIGELLKLEEALVLLSQFSGEEGRNARQKLAGQLGALRDQLLSLPIDPAQKDDLEGLLERLHKGLRETSRVN
jgi:hypothetical protein